MGHALSTRSCMGPPTSARCPRGIPTSYTMKRRAEASSWLGQQFRMLASQTLAHPLELVQRFLRFLIVRRGS